MLCFDQGGDQWFENWSTNDNFCLKLWLVAFPVRSVIHNETAFTYQILQVRQSG